MHAAWERITKLQKLNMIEATHTDDPNQMRNALLVELAPGVRVSTPFRRIMAAAQGGKVASSE